MAARPFIIDCDCGVDDAEAIILATSRSDIDILAITCVGGNCGLENVARNVLHVLNIAGKPGIPVYKGLAGSIVRGRSKYDSKVHGTDGLGDIVHTLPKLDDPNTKPEHAVIKMIEIVKQRPKEITLFACGPLSNVAMAHRLWPELSENLKEMFIMGGNVAAHGNRHDMMTAEFNFGSDAEAAYMILEEFKCPITIMPWESCHGNALDWAWFERWLSANSTKADFIRKMLQQGMQRRRQAITGHQGYFSCDLMAMAIAIDPSVMTEYIEKWVSVELHGQYTKGQTVIDWPGYGYHGAPNAKIAIKLDSKKLEAMFEQMIL